MSGRRRITYPWLYFPPNQVNTQIPTTFEIDPFSGTIIWDKPLMQGEYNIAFLIEEWRYGG